MKKILLIICALITVLFFPIGVHASGEAELQGEASTLNTEGTLSLDDHNSNVTVSPETGNITGYAWSEDLGWINFHSAENPVTINLDTYNVTGEADVLNTGGKLYFTGYSSNVTLDKQTNAFTGYAWSEDSGWIDFSGVTVSDELAETGKNFRNYSAVSFLILLFIFRFLRTETWRSIKN